MLKKPLLLTVALSFLIVGCSSDPNYKREMVGSEDYLAAAQLRPLIIPEGITIPSEKRDYYIFNSNSSKSGEVGRKLDIRSPVLPLPTVYDTNVVYGNGILTADLPMQSGLWQKIPDILTNKNIPIVKSDNTTIKTEVVSIAQAEGLEPVNASYLLKRQISNNREYITIELTSLKVAGQTLSDSINSQRYTVTLFNTLMSEFAPLQ